MAEIQGLVDAARDESNPEMVGWSKLAWRFHDLLMERAGNRALAIQWGVLRDVTETHLASVIRPSSDRTETLKTFRKSLRSYAKLVQLIEARDADGAAARTPPRGPHAAARGTGPGAGPCRPTG